MRDAERPRRKAANDAEKRISIDDVAKAASVSVATVSRVLNSPELVAPGTAERVQRVIDELDYRPNLFAKVLMTRKSNVLAFALPDIFGEFYSEMLRGADTEARELGYHLLVSSETRLNTEQSASQLAFGLVDGIALMVTEPNDELLAEAQRRRRPLVVLDVDLREQGIDSVVIDNSTGTCEAVAHLLASTPPERCYYVGGPKDNFDNIERLTAFRGTIEEAGHTLRRDQVSHGDYTMETGERWWRERANGDSLHDSAIVAANDEIAYGVMTAAQADGVVFPDDVRIVGFDNSHLSELARPKLSSVRIPATEAGATAIRMLVNRLNHPEATATRTLLPTRLIARESSRVRDAGK